MHVSKYVASLFSNQLTTKLLFANVSTKLHLLWVTNAQVHVYSMEFLPVGALDVKEVDEYL